MVRSIPSKIFSTDYAMLSQICRQYGTDHYNNRRFDEALLWYSLQIKLIVVWITSLRVTPGPYSEREVSSYLSESYFNRGNTYDELGEFSKALEDYECALKFHNTRPWNVLLNRALVYEKIGNLVNANNYKRN